MRKRYVPECIILGVLAVSSLFAVVLTWAEPPKPGWTTNGRVERVIDGDTVDVSVPIVVRIRLKDCWSPEINTKNEPEHTRGVEAKEFLKQQLPKGQAITLHVDFNTDVKDVLSLNRILGTLWKGDDNVSSIMVRNGYATSEKGKK
jgi:endonuclease YncB( thermonuclease family)